MWLCPHTNILPHNTHTPPNLKFLNWIEIHQDHRLFPNTQLSPHRDQIHIIHKYTIKVLFYFNKSPSLSAGTPLPQQEARVLNKPLCEPGAPSTQRHSTRVGWREGGRGLDKAAYSTLHHIHVPHQHSDVKDVVRRKESSRLITNYNLKLLLGNTEWPI